MKPPLLLKKFQLSFSRKECISFLLMMLVFINYNQAQNVPELMYFKFDGTGNTTLNSASSPVGNNPAQIVGTNLTIGTPSLFGTALVGTGSSSTTDHVSTGWATNLVSIDWTLSFWINNVPSSTTLYYLLGDATNLFRCFVNGAPGQGNMRLTGTGLPTVDVTNVTGQSVVVHFVRTVSPNEIQVYRNGVYVSSHAITGTPTIGSNFIIGGYSSNSGLLGQMDELRLYNRALTASEISSTWNQSLPLTACAGSPAAGTAVSSSMNVCPSQNFNLSLTGQTMASGLDYQWQSSPSPSGPWTNIPGAINQAVITSQLTNTSYRCIITCTNSNLTDTSTVVSVSTSPNLPGGTYTIGATGNYTSFSSAINAMNCGIAGPVTFNVLPGVYNEQVIIGDILGASATNTITFNGADTATTKITFNSTVSAERHTIRLDGAKFIRIKNLTIESTSTTNAFIVHMTNGCFDIELTSNQVILNSSVTPTTAYGCIVASGSLTSATGTGHSVKKLLIENNKIINAYYGIALTGIAADRVSDALIRNNSILNSFYFGVNLTQTIMPSIIGNRILMNPTGNNAAEGINITTSDGPFNFSDNVITNPGNFGIYISGVTSTAANPSKIINNSIGGGFRGTANTAGGIRMIGTMANVQIYYNSINFDNAAGSALNIRVNTVTNLDIRNNNFVYSGGAGGYAMYLNTTTNNIASHLNHNNYFSNGTAFVYYGSALANLQSLQAINSPTGNDANSGSVNPQFTSATNLIPLNVALKAGTPLAGNTKDVRGFLRNIATPTIGSYEIAPTLDLGVNGLASPLGAICPSNSENVVVQISNYASQPLDFAANPTTVTVSVAGAVTQTLTYTINNNSLSANVPLPAGATLSVPVGTLNMSTPGTYNFAFQVSFSGDLVSNNDSMAQTAVVNPLPAITTQPTSVAECVGLNTSFQVVATGSALTYQWNKDNIVISGANSSSLNVSNITAADAGLYSVDITDACGTVSSTQATLTVNVLPTVTTNATSTAICEGDEVTLSASGADIYTWTHSITDGISFSPATTETYVVTGTDANGCVNTDGITIVVNELPELSFTTIDAKCFNGSDGEATVSINGGIAPASSVWSNSQTSQTATGLSAGTYIVTVTDAEGCTNFDEVVINEPTEIIVSLVSMVEPDCYGGNNGEATVDATGGTPPYSYTWPTGQSGQTALGLEAGSHNVITTDDNGCVNTFTATVTQPSEIAPSATITHVSCFGGNNGIIQVTATGGTTFYTYSWAGGHNGINLSAGEYTLTITDSDGCSVDASYTVTEPAMLDTSVTVAGITLTAALNNASYQWFNCTNNIPVSGATEQSFTPSADGEYLVRVTKDGCTEESSCHAIIGVGIQNYATASNLKIYPNPNSGSFFITSDIEAEFMLVNGLGQLVQKILVNASNNYKTEINSLSAGVYYLIGSKEHVKIVVTK
jgi:hypothetical protein